MDGPIGDTPDEYEADVETPRVDAVEQHTPLEARPADPEDTAGDHDATLVGIEVPVADALEQAASADTDGDDEWPHSGEEAPEPPWMD